MHGFASTLGKFFQIVPHWNSGVGGPWALRYATARKIKIKIFQTAVEHVLLYGVETWTPKKADIRALDGVYTRMLRRVFDISWKSHTSNSVLCRKIPSVTDNIKTRRLRFAGHVYRLQDQPAQQLLFGNHPMAIVIKDDCHLFINVYWVALSLSFRLISIRCCL